MYFSSQLFTPYHQSSQSITYHLFSFFINISESCICCYKHLKKDLSKTYSTVFCHHIHYFPSVKIHTNCHYIVSWWTMFIVLCHTCIQLPACATYKLFNVVLCCAFNVNIIPIPHLILTCGNTYHIMHLSTNDIYF